MTRPARRMITDMLLLKIHDLISMVALIQSPREISTSTGVFKLKAIVAAEGAYCTIVQSVVHTFAFQSL